MRAISRRVEALERASGMSWKPWHIILKDEDEPYLSAFRRYRAKNPDRTIEPDDNCFWVVGVSAKLDVDGNAVPRHPPNDLEGPSLGEMLRQAAADE